MDLYEEFVKAIEGKPNALPTFEEAFATQRVLGVDWLRQLTLTFAGREPGHAVAKGRRGGMRSIEGRMPGAPTKRVAFSHDAKMRASPCRRLAGLSPTRHTA